MYYLEVFGFLMFSDKCLVFVNILGGLVFGPIEVYSHKKYPSAYLEIYQIDTFLHHFALRHDVNLKLHT